MEWLLVAAQLGLDFLVGTLVLWFCSLATSSPHANIKTAAIFNAIMVVVGLGVVVLAFLVLTGGMGGGIFLLILLTTLVVSLVLLMWLYEISFFASLFLAIGMIAVSALVERFVEVVF